MAGDTFNQNHSGSGDNIINLGKQKSRMTESVMAAWAAKMRNWPTRFGVGVHGTNPESVRQADQLHRYLISHNLNCVRGGGAQFDPGCHAHISLTTLGIDTPYILVDADK